MVQLSNGLRSVDRIPKVRERARRNPTGSCVLDSTDSVKIRRRRGSVDSSSVRCGEKAKTIGDSTQLLGSHAGLESLLKQFTSSVIGKPGLSEDRPSLEGDAVLAFGGKLGSKLLKFCTGFGV